MDKISLVLASIGLVTSILAIIVILRRKGDVNLDGKVDEADLQIVKAEISKNRKKTKKKVSKKKVSKKKVTRKKVSRNKKSDS